MEATRNFKERFKQQMLEIDNVRKAISVSLSDADKLSYLLTQLIKVDNDFKGCSSLRIEDKVRTLQSLVSSARSLLRDVAYFKSKYTNEKLVLLNKNKQQEEILYFFSREFEERVNKFDKEATTLYNTVVLDKYICGLVDKDLHKDRFVKAKKEIVSKWPGINPAFLSNTALTRKDHIFSCFDQYEKFKPYEERAKSVLSRGRVDELKKAKEDLLKLNLPDLKHLINDLVSRIDKRIAEILQDERDRAAQKKKARAVAVVSGIFTIGIPAALLLFYIVFSIIVTTSDGLNNLLSDLTPGQAYARGIIGGFFLGIFRFIISLSGISLIWQESMAGLPIPAFVTGIVGLAYFVFTWIFAVVETNADYFRYDDWSYIGKCITKVMFYIGFCSTLFSILALLIYTNGSMLAARYNGNYFGGYVLGIFYTIWDLIKLVILQGFWSPSYYLEYPIVNAMAFNGYFYAMVAVFVVTLVFLCRETINRWLNW